jgi:ubiquitin-activating enzyme E1
MSCFLDFVNYDRQIRAYGINASKKINSGCVCIIGLKGGYSSEIIKNLVSCGLKNIYLFDDSTIDEKDIETGYFYSCDDLHKKCNEVLVEKLKEFNPLVKITIINEINKLLEINVLIVINQSYEINIHYNNFTHRNNLKFICINSHNFEGHIFLDASRIHKITEQSSENYEELEIINITHEGIVITNNHNYKSNDLINIYNLEGVNIEYLNQQWFIEVIDKNKFKLNNFTYNNFTFINGSCNFVHQPIFITNYCLETFEDNIFKNFIYNYNENIAVISILGSIVAFETIKLISNKYLPINQFYSWTEEYITGDYLSKITNSEWLLIGAGTIGCEILKNLAYLNVKNIKIIDPKLINESSLTAHCLFTKKDIGKYKSDCALEKIKLINSSIEIESIKEQVNYDNKHFIDNLLKTKKINGVFNAINNIHTDKFMDEQCFSYNCPLFEVSALSVKGTVQPVIPFITETYSNTNEPFIEKTYPLCIIQNFPNNNAHLIEWALEQFIFFSKGPNSLNSWLQNKDLIFPNTTEGLQMNNNIYLFSNKYKIRNWVNCVTFALDMFNENYKYNIKKLLLAFPNDHLTTENTLFWANGKRCPTPLEFDITNNLHINYIYSTVKLLCTCLSLETSFTKTEILEEIKNYHEILYDTDKIFYDLDKTYTISNINPQYLEKNNEDHIMWLQCASELRATNYNIKFIDFYTTKGIVCKITPINPLIISIISGLTIIEMLKSLENAPLEHYKLTNINLAENLVLSNEPIKAPTITICNKKFNSWFKFIHNEDCLLKEFKTKYEELFNSEIKMILNNSTIIYADFTGSDNFNKKLTDIFIEFNIDITNQIELNIFFEDENIELPPIIFSQN